MGTTTRTLALALAIALAGCAGNSANDDTATADPADLPPGATNADTTANVGVGTNSTSPDSAGITQDVVGGTRPSEGGQTVPDAAPGSDTLSTDMSDTTTTTTGGWSDTTTTTTTTTDSMRLR